MGGLARVAPDPAGDEGRFNHAFQDTWRIFMCSPRAVVGQREARRDITYVPLVKIDHCHFWNSRVGCKVRGAENSVGVLCSSPGER